MKLWAREERKYFDNLKDAKQGAEYCDTFWVRFNGIHYDGEIGKYYVSYVYKY